MRKTTKSALALAAALAFTPAAHATQLTEEQLNNVDGFFRSNGVLTDWAIDKATETLRAEGAAPVAPLSSREAFNVLYQKDLIDTPGLNRMDLCTLARFEKMLKEENWLEPQDSYIGQNLPMMDDPADAARENARKSAAPIAAACYRDYRAKIPFELGK